MNIKTDVLVVGAGAAGLAAAISAGRNGAKTLLIEYNGFLGGISATLPWLGFHDRDYRQVVKGLPAEFCRRLREMDGASDYELDVKCGSLVSVHSHLWKCLAMQMAREAGVKILLHTHMVDTVRNWDRIEAVVVETKSGRQTIEANIVIDCSGDGDVAARSGAPWKKGRTRDGLVQAPTLVFNLSGVNRARLIEACKDDSLLYREWLRKHPDLLEKNGRRLDRVKTFVFGGFAGLIEQAREAGDFPIPQTRVVGVKLHTEDEFSVVMTRVLGLDPTDVESVSDAYALVYEQIPHLARFFKKWVPGFEDSRIKEIAPMLGVRESRRIMGDYVMTKDDVVSGRRFDDAISMGAYHIDIHNPSGGWVESYNVKAYTVPIRSLMASGLENLGMAGKCLSATHEAVASTRVIPICMGQGQAIGTAAALAVKSATDLRSVSVETLQGTLMDQGAEIGQSLGEPNWQAIEEIGQLPFEEEELPEDGDPVSSLEGAWLK